MNRTFVTRFALLLTAALVVPLLAGGLTGAESLDPTRARVGFGKQSPSPTPTPRPVTGGGLPVVSPDGKIIAFVSNRNGTPDVFVIAVDSRAELQLTHTPEPEAAVQWSANGKQVVFSILSNDTSRIFVINPDGQNLREMGSIPGRAPMVSPDGKWLLYTAGTWTATKLMVSAFDGTQSRQLTDGSSIAWNNHWSPDGKRIAFTGRENPEAELAIFIMNADGSSTRKVTNIPPLEGGAQWPVWSPDGRRLAIQVNSRVQKNSAHIWIVDVATGKANKLAAHADAYLDETPSWFPNGKRIAFQSNRSGKMEVWVMSPDGSALRQVTGLAKK